MDKAMDGKQSEMKKVPVKGLFFLVVGVTGFEPATTSTPC